MLRISGPSPRPSAHTAFTLIELVVVVVIIAIAAAAIAPRMTRNDGRRAEASAIAVREVVSAAAARAELTGARVALAYDAKSRLLRLSEFRWIGTPAAWDTRGQWVEDSLVPPATLEDAEFSTVRADGFEADPSSWTVEFAPGSRRPFLSVVVTQEKSSRAWRIELPSGSMRAEMTDAGVAVSSQNSAVDLDASGRQEEPW